MQKHSDMFQQNSKFCIDDGHNSGLAVCIFAGELSIARLICSGELNPEHI